MKKVKKRTKIIKQIILISIYIFLVLSILYNIIYLVNSTIFQKKYLNIFGITLLCMNTDLMENDINTNDLIIAKKMDNDLEIKDIIAYEVNDEIRINRIIHYDDVNYTTKFDKTLYPDVEKTSDTYIIGKVIKNIHYLGVFLKIIQSKIYSIFIFTILIIKFIQNQYVTFQKSVRIKKMQQTNNQKYYTK